MSAQKSVFEKFIFLQILWVTCYGVIGQEIMPELMPDVHSTVDFENSADYVYPDMDYMMILTEPDSYEQDSREILFRQSQLVPVPVPAQPVQIPETMLALEEPNDDVIFYDYEEFGPPPDYGGGWYRPPPPGSGWPSGPPPQNNNKPHGQGQGQGPSKFKPKPKPKPTKPKPGSKPPIEAIEEHPFGGDGWTPLGGGWSESQGQQEGSKEKDKDKGKDKFAEIKDKWNKFIDKFKIKEKDKDKKPPQQQQQQQQPNPGGGGGWGQYEPQGPPPSQPSNNNNNNNNGWGQPVYIPVGPPPPGSSFFEIIIGRKAQEEKK